jgi:hypothetical protein
MAVAVHRMRSGTAPLPNTWHGHIRWWLAVPIVGLGLLSGIIGSTAMTHGAEVAQGIEAGREMVASTGAWLSTAAAQAFTMQCTHARVR